MGVSLKLWIWEAYKPMLFFLERPVLQARSMLTISTLYLYAPYPLIKYVSTITTTVRQV